MRNKDNTRSHNFRAKMIIEEIAFETEQDIYSGYEVIQLWKELEQLSYVAIKELKDEDT